MDRLRSTGVKPYALAALAVVAGCLLIGFSGGHVAALAPGLILLVAGFGAAYVHGQRLQTRLQDPEHTDEALRRSLRRGGPGA